MRHRKTPTLLTAVALFAFTHTYKSDTLLVSGNKCYLSDVCLEGVLDIMIPHELLAV